jgi:transposase
MQDEDTMPASADVPGIGHETNYTGGVQLRYNYRLYPSPGQRDGLARAFGCARVVFNDGLRARQEAHAAGQPYLTDAELSARLTASKATPERVWLGKVSAVVLQQSLADLNTAYRNFFASVTGKRKGPKIEPPRFKSPQGSQAGGPVHGQRPVQGAGQREAAAAQDRGRSGPLVPGSAI